MNISFLGTQGATYKYQICGHLPCNITSAGFQMPNDIYRHITGHRPVGFAAGKNPAVWM